MEISKKELKKMIREETKNVLNESNRQEMEPDDFVRQLIEWIPVSKVKYRYEDDNTFGQIEEPYGIEQQFGEQVIIGINGDSGHVSFEEENIEQVFASPVIGEIEVNLKNNVKIKIESDELYKL